MSERSPPSYCTLILITMHIALSCRIGVGLMSQRQRGSLGVDETTKLQLGSNDQFLSYKAQQYVQYQQILVCSTSSTCFTWTRQVRPLLQHFHMQYHATLVFFCTFVCGSTGERAPGENARGSGASGVPCEGSARETEEKRRVQGKLEVLLLTPVPY